MYAPQSKPPKRRTSTKAKLDVAVDEALEAATIIQALARGSMTKNNLYKFIYQYSIARQPPNSPDLNALDVGFFNSLQTLRYQKKTRTIPELLEAVQESLDELDERVIEDTFLTLQSVMVEIMPISVSLRPSGAMAWRRPAAVFLAFLNGNNFAVVTPDMFRGYTKNDRDEWNDVPVPLFQLREIKLDLNPMPVVSEFAFRDVPTLQLMYDRHPSQSLRREHDPHVHSYLPFYVQIQHQGLSEMRLDKDTFDGFTRVPVHPLEDPTFVAFTRYTSPSG
ncbi:hypothetical protein DYB32_004459 [Aphanomyces invadans]|uniref:Uncharacterized protein n=1 Tax=Aphanomyces invadans TaxID=157072 RepID=A0A418AXF5_9STRA|nr:hypothetical protein DYB32_004459 [Aphanomyces invadans]